MNQLTLNVKADFDEFWGNYPRKQSKPVAKKAWDKLNPDSELLAVMIENIQARLAAGEWDLNDKLYIPHAATYLNQRRFEDEVIQSKAITNNQPQGFVERHTDRHWADGL